MLRLVILLRLPANFAAIQGWQNDAIHHASQSERIFRSIREDRTLLRIATAQTVQFQAICELSNHGNRCTPLRVFGSEIRPFHMERETNNSPLL